MAIFNYNNIKILAKSAGQRVTDLLALAPQNDPFYAGTPTDVKQAQWFAKVWQKAGYTSGVHLRRVHYWCVSQRELTMHNGKPYQNTDQCWNYLTQASKVARYLGLVKIADIADNKNPDPHQYALYYDDNPAYEIDTPDLEEPGIDIYGIHNTNAQPYHLEVWCEKSTMNDVLLPVCEEYAANLVTFEGEVSITACYELIKRIHQAEKPTRVLYISDFDPAGNSMPVAMSRKIEYMIQKYGIQQTVKVRSLVLTLDQVRQYQLPRTPIKKTEKRATSFQEAFGTGAVELDALEALYPGVLERIVRDAIKPYWSEAAAREAARNYLDLRQAIREKVEEITADYADQIEDLREMIERLEAIDIDPEPYRISRYDADVEELEDWLFDSNRDYEDQIAYYKEHKGIET